MKVAQKGDIEVKYFTENNDHTLLVSHVSRGMTPDDFLPFLADFEGFVHKFNPYLFGKYIIQEFKRMEGTGNKFDTYKGVIWLPAPLQNRYGFLTAYHY